MGSDFTESSLIRVGFARVAIHDDTRRLCHYPEFQDQGLAESAGMLGECLSPTPYLGVGAELERHMARHRETT